MSLKKYKSQGKGAEVTMNSKEETLKTSAWISYKNSASVRPQSCEIVPLAATISKALIGRKFYSIIYGKSFFTGKELV